MGAKFSPSLANIYVVWWESLFLFSHSNVFATPIAWYNRYINDLLFIWRSNVTALPAFFEYINNNCFGLKFSYIFEKDKINFLDLT